ncbi:MAG: thioredoxin domain-containing protein [Deltaproteobacteria bacterium]|nr:thioredoxin domain-containing protein [Deltaproteobacteria bacterium]
MRTHFSSKLILPVSERDHISGPASAPVTLVEYGDYECPYCGLANPIVDQIRRELGDQLRFVFRNFPLTEVHPHSEHAAEIAEAAGAHHKFWEMHDLLYARQQELDDQHLAEYLAQLGVPASEVKLALAQHAYADRLREDFMSGVRSGVNGTPTFFINGLRHDGSYERDELLAAIAVAAR